MLELAPLAGLLSKMIKNGHPIKIFGLKQLSFSPVGKMLEAIHQLKTDEKLEVPDG